MTLGTPLSGAPELVVITGEDDSYCWARSNPESFERARRLTTVIGDMAPIVDRYLEALSYAPPAHLVVLEQRDTRIVMGNTIDAVLNSPWAMERRGHELTWDEKRQVRIDLGPESLTAGIYDEGTNALIFPTSYAAIDRREVVLHELGHALTYRRTEARAELLEELPTRIRRHVFQQKYEGASASDTQLIRVREALAEAYIYLVLGRANELSAALTSELVFMLQTVDEDDKVRFDFERTPDGHRTASRRSHREIVDASDPEEGHLFAPVRMTDDTVARDLADDEIGARRRRRGVA